MRTYTSSLSFEFSGSTCKWHLVAVNSYGGHSEFGQGIGDGVFKIINKWQINFSKWKENQKPMMLIFLL